MNADERIIVSEKALSSAGEQVRIEDLRYRSGDNTSTDVINAEAALIRSRSDHYQARFDRHVAVAFLKKALGDMDIPSDTASDNGTSRAPVTGKSTIPTKFMTEEKK